MSDQPPSYEEASQKPSNPTARNGIPPEARRSMEDLHRPLPPGWVRQHDPETHHQFFVDTKANPPRSIWHHPYDDPEFLEQLDPGERENVLRLQRSVSLKDITAESSSDEGGSEKRPRSRSRQSRLSASGPSTSAPATGAPGPSPTLRPPPDGDEVRGLQKFGRRLKDRVTGSTHAEREQERLRRAEAERQAYETHLAFRQAMSRAIQTGQPQFIGRDGSGKEVYIEPPDGLAPPSGAHGYNPYAQGPYTNPNARFIRPDYPYARPYGYGYGGGYGLPLVGGLLGGALLGGLLF